MMRFTILAAIALGSAEATDVQVLDAAAKVAEKHRIEDSSEWFRHKFQNEWGSCSVTSCKDVSGEVEVFSSEASDPTRYLLRSAGAIDRGIQSRNRARLNDNRNFKGEHWHCEATDDPSVPDGCECKCSMDTDCKSIKHSDRFVKVCNGQTVEEQYTASDCHKEMIASVDAGVALIPGTDGCGNACDTGTYNIHGVGACSPHTTCGSSQVLTGASTSAAGSCVASGPQWILDHRTPRGSESCDVVCADNGKTCSQSSLDNLNNNDAAFAAAFDAWSPGHCKKWNTGCTGGNNCAAWGSPFIHSSHVNDHLCWRGSPVAACGQRPVDGHDRRLCPCA